MTTTPTHRIKFRLIDGETTEQLVHARSVTHNVYPAEEWKFNAEKQLTDDIARKLTEGHGVFDYTVTQKYGGPHLVPVRHVLWAKVEPLASEEKPADS